MTFGAYDGPARAAKCARDFFGATVIGLRASRLKSLWPPPTSPQAAFRRGRKRPFAPEEKREPGSNKNRGVFSGRNVLEQTRSMVDVKPLVQSRKARGAMKLRGSALATDLGRISAT